MSNALPTVTSTLPPPSIATTSRSSWIQFNHCRIWGPYEVFDASSVSHGYWRGGLEQTDEVSVHSTTLSFDVDSMDEELSAGVGQVLHGGRVDCQLTEMLPTVSDDPIPSVAKTAT